MQHVLAEIDGADLHVDSARRHPPTPCLWFYRDTEGGKKGGVVARGRLGAREWHEWFGSNMRYQGDSNAAERRS